MHFVYVDDQIDDLDPVVKTLRKQNHEVIIINDLFTALAYLREHEPDILLCDLILGDGPNGLVLAENVRNLYRACTIVMVSFYVTTESTVRAIQVGVNDFVQRPVTVAELLERIWAAMTRHRVLMSPSRSPVNPRRTSIIDTTRHKAVWHGEDLDLTPTEFGLLKELATKPDRVLTFVDLWLALRGEVVPHGEARLLLKPHISSLRAKLTQTDQYPDPIQSIRGTGYLWHSQDE